MELLLDGLNEMPGEVAPWRAFLREMVEQNPDNRAVFACRTRDYSGRLESEQAPASVVVVEALSDIQMKAFLERYAPEQAAGLWAQLKESDLLDFYRTPYFLSLLVGEADDGQIPEGLAPLFTRFVREAWRRELRRETPSVKTPGLVEERDVQRVQAGGWRSPTDLPDQGSLVARLARFAFEMQALGDEDGKAARQNVHRSVAADAAMDLLGEAWGQQVLEAAYSLGVLEQELEGDEVRFSHQLFQEHFAARHFLRHRDFHRVAMEWRASHVKPTLEETITSLGGNDPLPYQATLWDETIRAAASMAQDIDTFIVELAEHNLPLAGRAAMQPDVSLSSALRDELKTRLLNRCEDPRADLRARIEAGLPLGHLGDPRFTKYQGPYGDYLLPPFVTVPGGRYVIGSDTGDDDEKPARKVDIEGFEVARYPVTNAEWALFIAAGGYDEERWWETEADKAWRTGETTAEGPRNSLRSARQHLQNSANFAQIIEREDLTPDDVEHFEWLADCSDEEFEEWVEKKYPDGRQREPAQWRNDAFNYPSQPVVGICWHEARAYCAWLTTQSDSPVPFVLPTEHQWEAAARGGDSREYPWAGDFAAERCNTFESHIRRTTPVGIYPDGDRVLACGERLSDMSGNVWEWTRNVYQSYAKGENTDPGAEGSRVLRGGSWDYSLGFARASYRDSNVPGEPRQQRWFSFVSSVRHLNGPLYTGIAA